MTAMAGDLIPMCTLITSGSGGAMGDGGAWLAEIAGMEIAGMEISPSTVAVLPQT